MKKGSLTVTVPQSGPDLNPITLTCKDVMYGTLANGISAGQNLAMCVRGPSAPKSQCALTMDFVLGMIAVRRRPTKLKVSALWLVSEAASRGSGEIPEIGEFMRSE